MRENDLRDVRVLLNALASGGPIVEGGVLTLVHQGPPVAWQRARWNPATKQFFTDTKTRDAEESLGWAFTRARAGVVFRDTVALVCVFYMPTPRRRKGDGDNLQKLVMDAGTKGRAWADDDQVVAAAWRIECDPEQPRTVIAACPYLNTMTRAPLLGAEGVPDDGIRTATVSHGQGRRVSRRVLPRQGKAAR